MRTYRQQLTITSDSNEQFLNLSFEVEECVRRSFISEGICVVYSQHTTSAIFLENDREDLFEDWTEMLRKIVPDESNYKVDYTSAGAAHMKQMLLGRQRYHTRHRGPPGAWSSSVHHVRRLRRLP